MSKEITRNTEDLLKLTNKKLGDLLKREDFANLSMGLCQETAHVELKICLFESEFAAVSQSQKLLTRKPSTEPFP